MCCVRGEYGRKTLSVNRKTKGGRGGETLKGETAGEHGRTRVRGRRWKGGEADELTPGSRVSQGASMQGMLPDSPWYWLVSRPGIHLAHPYFTLSVAEGGEIGSGLGVCVCVYVCVYTWGQLVLGLRGCGGGVLF